MKSYKILVPGLPMILMGTSILIVLYVLLHKGVVISDKVLGSALGTSASLIAVGLNDLGIYLRSTTTLKADIDLEVFHQVRSGKLHLDQGSRISSIKYLVCRVSALIYNKGIVMVDNAKATVEVKEPSAQVLRTMLVPKEGSDCKKHCPYGADCSSQRGSRTYLVDIVNPRIKGELLPWACPDKPVPRPGSADLVHITSISPGQSAKLLLFEFIPVKNDRFLVRIFSEYGAPGPNDIYPRHFRACLFVGKNDVLKLKITVAGKNLKCPLQFYLTIRGEILSDILKYIQEDDIDKAIRILRKCFKN